MAGGFSTWVWSPQAAAAVAAELDAAGITPRARAAAQRRRRREPICSPPAGSSGYVVALGGCALLLVAAAALVLAVRLADRDAVSDVLLRRMSYGGARPGRGPDLGGGVRGRARRWWPPRWRSSPGPGARR